MYSKTLKLLTILFAGNVLKHAMQDSWVARNIEMHLVAASFNSRLALPTAMVKYLQRYFTVFINLNSRINELCVRFCSVRGPVEPNMLLLMQTEGTYVDCRLQTFSLNLVLSHFHL